MSGCLSRLAVGAYQWALVSNDPRANPQTHRGDDRQPLDQGSQGSERRLHGKRWSVLLPCPPLGTTKTSTIMTTTTTTTTTTRTDDDDDDDDVGGDGGSGGGDVDGGSGGGDDPDL